jgi:hypothetical protein
MLNNISKYNASEIQLVDRISKKQTFITTKKLQIMWMKEQRKPFEKTTGWMRPEQANTWPYSQTAMSF